MTALPAQLPDRPTLQARLSAVFDGESPVNGSVRILARRPPHLLSTFPGEVVTFRVNRRRTQRVFIKYEVGLNHNAFGHRGGVAYEAEVYRRVLGTVPKFRPKCYGAHTDRASGETCLLLEYLDNCIRASDLSTNVDVLLPRIMGRTARWLGKFHAAHESRTTRATFRFLKAYDEKYFRAWARRTVTFAKPMRRFSSWLTKVYRRCDDWIEPLLAAPLTIIHGEFYIKTVLLRRGKIFPVDWESAAISAGEIDLASLTEGTGWESKLVALSEREYCRARWPRGTPGDFQRTLDAARIYLHFRWLGERPDWTTRQKSLWRFDHLHAAAQRLGLI